ncbi:Starch-binding associating with outer membrane [Ekhidna lutea]|uniref:Starch-binding associating with outer membrane n=1 Tax=Ekhidna lutea TaxID=447679 RepID=A0A239EEF7_EKHLU|nr:RagB/SusD family nutrient uptake outer membrane protein [Ekhidna lutea]SNS42997.1 Starch-binding associating with outer membrane [Ekhidna lutea]
MKAFKTTQSTMKHLIAFFLLASITFSCDNLLDIDAENSLSGDILTDQESVEQALNGAYYNFFGMNDGSDGGELLGGDFKLIATLLTRQVNLEVSWDETNAPGYEDFVRKSVLETNIRVESNWRRGYETINIVNDILANLDVVTDASARSRIEGEARAIRGILYFEMARLWGPQYEGSANDPAIPLLLEPITSVGEITTPTKATVNSIYSQVEADLNAASTALESLGTNNDRISYYACQAYLAKVAMQKNEYFDAEDFLDNVIAGPFSLASSPSEAFSNASNSTEDILAVQQTASSNTGVNTSGLSAFFNSFNDFGSTFRIQPSSLNSGILANNPKFSDADHRANIDSASNAADEVDSLYYLDKVNTNSISSAKYLRSTDVIPLIRLAEMYLDRAESRFEQDPFTLDPQALSDLNTVRTRAGLTALLDTLTASEFYDSLIVERNRELLYEGVIFHDLKRQAANGLSVHITNSRLDPLADRFILPIPQSECDASPGLCN